MFDIFIGFLLGIAVLGILMFPQAYPELFRTGILPRLKTWWPLFVKRHIVDVDPEAPDPQSPTRYVPEQYVDWKKLPDNALFVAADCDGRVWWYSLDPHIFYRYWRPCPSSEPIEDLGRVRESTITAPLPPWQESKRRRPE